MLEKTNPVVQQDPAQAAAVNQASASSSHGNLIVKAAGATALATTGNLSPSPALHGDFLFKCALGSSKSSEMALNPNTIGLAMATKETLSCFRNVVKGATIDYSQYYSRYDFNIDPVAAATQLAQNLRNYPNLERLSLTGAINDKALETLAEFKQLKALNLLDTYSRLTPRGVHAIQDLVNLERLEMSAGTTIGDDELACLAFGLPNLRHLVLSNCGGVTGDALGTLSDLSQLKHLELHQLNRIPGCALGYLSDCTALEHLSLTCEPQIPGLDGFGIFAPQVNNHVMDLAGPPWQQVHHLTNLRALALNGANLGSYPLALLTQLPNLKRLDLSHCSGLEYTNPASIAGFGQLEHLTLANCDLVTDEVLQHIGSMPNLRALDISHNHFVTDQGIAHLANLEHLEHLNLSGLHHITPESLYALAKLKNLQSLDVSGSPLMGLQT
ncbi:MAG TPA: hypothetical protein VFV57_07600 [Limnobacter sp.]|nr:hypothetical protein [Limnobacter sp.]